MKNKQKNICLLIAGGTTLDDRKISETTITKATDVSKWLKQISEAFLIAKITPEYITSGHEDISGVKLWGKVSNYIFDNYDKYDGFVILFDLSEILFNGIALSFSLQNLSKPVILTGSQLSDVDSPKKITEKKNKRDQLGVKSNLINAVQMATMNFPAVGILFGNQCVRPAKAIRSVNNSLNAFISADGSYLAKIDFGISPQEKLPSVNKKIKLVNDFEEKVAYLKYYPGFNIELLKGYLKESQGFIIENLIDQPIPKQIINNLSLVKTPFVIYSKKFTRLNKKNLIEITNMTPETIMVKLMWSLPQVKNFEDLRVLMYRDVISELIE